MDALAAWLIKIAIAHLRGKNLMDPETMGAYMSEEYLIENVNILIRIGQGTEKSAQGPQMTEFDPLQERLEGRQETWTCKSDR